MTNKEKLKELVDLFRKNIDQYKSPNYKEQSTRTQFINKLFTYLEWDVDNSDGFDEEYSQVSEEDTIYVEGKAKAPDYSFRIGGNRKFFVEAKKPSVKIAEEKAPAYQTRCYGFSAKLPISILTDFEEFAIYDTSITPDKNDNPSKARIFYCTYEDYEKHFDYLYNLLSPNAIQKGSLNQFKKLDKKGMDIVDNEFLNVLSMWRIQLAESISKKNKDIDEIELNYIVQKLMNRIVFLRFAEDRGTTEYGTLRELLSIKSENFSNRWGTIFEEARLRYNSDLFSKDSRLDIELDQKTIKQLIDKLYYPNSPFIFNMIPIEFLGTIYEQFLGETITLDSKHKATVEEKPETRKAGGVFYTPSYIVNYIVENTVGNILKNKTPKDINDLSIVDPACGSGSFLIGVYQYLLDWYLTQYQSMFKKDSKNFLRADGQALTLQTRKDILTRHIYGVDLDSQAVEVSKLSLLLKLMEGEGAMDNAGLSFTYLPNLECNIKAGNSLVGKDYIDTIQVTLFDKKEQHKIKVFDWKSEFKTIFDRGGFDIVVGNPPYIFARNNMFTDEQKTYYYKNYPISEYQLNTYLMFTEKAYHLVKNEGLVGYIIPNNCLTINSFDRFRRFIVDNTSYLHIINSFDKVFSGASVDTCILIFGKTYQVTHKHIMGVLQNNEFSCAKGDFTDTLSKNYIINTAQCLDPNNPIPLIMDKINGLSKPISEYANIYDGLKTYETGKGIPKQTTDNKINNDFLSNKKDNATFEKMLLGSDIKRYKLEWSGSWISYGEWLAAPRKKVYFEEPRILIRQIISKYPYYINAIFTKDYLFNEQSGKIIRNFKVYTPLFILGILNCKLTSFWLEKTFFKSSRNIFPRVVIKDIQMFPIPILDLDNKKDKVLHDELVTKVEMMLDLQELDKDDTIIMQIQALDRQIDNLVYKMYNLTDDEIKVIEG